MIRVLVLYEQELDAAQYAEHAALCAEVPGGVFRHGKVFGAPGGDPQHRYYAEWEFPDRETFQAAAQSEQFLASGKDARDRGFPRPTVEFVSL